MWRPILWKELRLEALTGVPFPRNVELCTRFATQIVLRRASTDSISVRIIPDKILPDHERKSLDNFGKEKLELSKFGELVEEASKLMGLGLSANSKTPRAFSRDILSISICGPGRPSLTVVDTPGLIHSSGKNASSNDIKVIRDLVQEYVEEERTILLAVLSAKNDIANQGIAEIIRSSKNDAVNRTLGVITKPDDLKPKTQSESRFIALEET